MRATIPTNLQLKLYHQNYQKYWTWARLLDNRTPVIFKAVLFQQFFAIPKRGKYTIKNITNIFNRKPNSICTAHPQISRLKKNANTASCWTNLIRLLPNLVMQIAYSTSNAQNQHFKETSGLRCRAETHHTRQTYAAAAEIQTLHQNWWSKMTQSIWAKYGTSDLNTSCILKPATNSTLLWNTGDY